VSAARAKTSYASSMGENAGIPVGLRACANIMVAT
jgi:hypothetical protein